MKGSLDYTEVAAYIRENVVHEFYKIRQQRLEELTLAKLLTRKNPYLFRAKDIHHPWEYVQNALDAHLSSQEETKFGNLLEDLAIHVCSQVYGGVKAPEKKFTSIDLFFTKEQQFFMVGIKSGVNWGNSDQINALKNSFKKARRLLNEEQITTLPLVAVNGCCYGKDNNPFKADLDPEKSYYKYCGQEFWEFISGDSELYLRLIHPIKNEAMIRGPEFKKLYDKKLNDLTLKFQTEFQQDGEIDWEKLIKHVSQKRVPFSSVTDVTQ